MVNLEIMSIDFVVLGIAALIGLYMAANIGANDLANAMGTSLGSGAPSSRLYLFR